DLRTECPFLQQAAPPPAHKRSAAQSHAGGVLRLHTHHVALVEIRESPLCAKIEPILGNQCAAPARARRRCFGSSPTLVLSTLILSTLILSTLILSTLALSALALSALVLSAQCGVIDRFGERVLDHR